MNERDKLEQYERLLADNARLRAALRAIVARASGDFDQPDLVAYGPLAMSEWDMMMIARAALAACEVPNA